MRVEGTRGCLFLRSRTETGGDTPEIAAAVAAHKDALHQRISKVVALDLGHEDPLLAEQVLLLFEGATHAAIYRSADVVSAARSAVAVLIERARG